MANSIQELIDLNKDCPEEKINIAIHCTRSNINDMTEQEFLDFCKLERQNIRELVISNVIKEIYQYPLLPNIKNIEDSFFKGYRKSD